MENGKGKRIALLFVCVGLLILSGCVNYLKPELGLVAKVDTRVLLVDDHISNSVLKTKDLQFDYTLSGKDDTFDITGSLVFNRAITASYPVLDRFIMRVNFLDAEGVVIASESISPNISSFSAVPDVTQIKATGIKPPGSVAIAFNYYGTFAGVTLTGGGDSWEIYYMPFD